MIPTVLPPPAAEPMTATRPADPGAEAAFDDALRRADRAARDADTNAAPADRGRDERTGETDQAPSGEGSERTGAADTDEAVHERPDADAEDPENDPAQPTAPLVVVAPVVAAPVDGSGATEPGTTVPAATVASEAVETGTGAPADLAAAPLDSAPAEPVVTAEAATPEPAAIAAEADVATAEPATTGPDLLAAGEAETAVAPAPVEDGNPGDAPEATDQPDEVLRPTTTPAVDADDGAGPDQQQGDATSSGAAAGAPAADAPDAPIAATTPAADLAADAAPTAEPPVRVDVAAPAAAVAPPTAASAAAPATSAAPATAPPVVQQLVEQVTPLVDGPDGSHELTIELRPATLGRVQLEVTLEDGILHVHVQADDPSSRRLLTQSLDQLRAALTDAGIATGQLDVGDPRAGDPRTGHPGAGADERGGSTGSSGRPDGRSAADGERPTSPRPTGSGRAALDVLL